jgi:hypothetical protein
MTATVLSLAKKKLELRKLYAIDYPHTRHFAKRRKKECEWTMANKEHLKILEQGVEVWNEWRQENPEIAPNLRKASLYQIDLSFANFNNVNCNEAKLSKVKLKGAQLIAASFEDADLSQSDLTRADLTKARLVGTDLTDANLTDAILTESYLAFAKLHGATLKGATLRGARMSFTDFWDNDLSDASGLDEVHHLGPSMMDIATIQKSKGKIPEKFLRGCGVSEVFISYIPSLVGAMEPIQFYSCFISYSHADKSFARRLHDGLQGRGIRCWMDEHQLLPGDKIYTEVDRGIRLWDKVLLCCLKESLASWWVENEIQIAFEKEQQLRKQRGQDVLALIPLNLDGYLFDGWESGMATQIKSRLAADFTGWETDNSKFESEFEKLVKALRADAGGRESPPQSRL